MTASRERNDGKKRRTLKPDVRQAAAKGRRETPSDDWLWGWHPVVAALGNPRREPPQRLIATESRARELTQRFGDLPRLQIVTREDIERALPQGAAHQGLAVRASPLPAVVLDDFVATPGAVLLMLDQITDPQNVGAILRSAAAFGATGLVLQDRHAPKLSGALAKAAAGAVDALPIAQVVNLSRALEQLAERGWRSIGLAGEAETALAEALDVRPTVLVLGSEGEGLRRLVAEHCDSLARIPMPGGFESLNVSAAAAVALYETARAR